MIDHDAIEARLAAASAGEWMKYAPLYERGGFSVNRFPWPEGETEMVVQGGYDSAVRLPVGVLREPDADLIAHAPTDIAALLAENRRYKALEETVAMHHGPLSATTRCQCGRQLRTCDQWNAVNALHPEEPR